MTTAYQYITLKEAILLVQQMSEAMATAAPTDAKDWPAYESAEKNAASFLKRAQS